MYPCSGKYQDRKGVFLQGGIPRGCVCVCYWEKRERWRLWGWRWYLYIGWTKMRHWWWNWNTYQDEGNYTEHVSEVIRCRTVWWRTGNLFWFHDWKYTWIQWRLWRQDSIWPIMRGHRQDITGKRRVYVQWKRTSGSTRRMNWCHKYNRIVDHRRILCRIFKGVSVV